MRAACGDSRKPGMGNSIRALPTRVRVNRKPNIASTPKWTLTGILPRVAKQASRVVHSPDHDQGRIISSVMKKIASRGTAAEARILNGGNDLQKTYHNAATKRTIRSGRTVQRVVSSAWRMVSMASSWDIAYPKLFTSDPTIRFQPSTKTKSNILKGAEIITGGSCIIPIDNVIDATVRSITRKGKYRTAPI